MKLYKDLVVDAVKVTTQMAKHPLSFKDRTTKIQRRNFVAAAGVIGVNIFFDMVMMHLLGFERDTWGRRYRKQIIDEQGAKKDFYVTFASPENIIQRFTERVTKSFFDPGVANPFEQFLKMNQWELHPVYRNALAAVSNRGDAGKIYSDSDSVFLKGGKALWYFTYKTFDALNSIQSRTEYDAAPEERRRVINAWIKDYGKGLGTVLNSLETIFGFAYISEPETKRLGLRLKGMQKEFRKEAYQSVRNKGIIDPALIEKYKQRQKAVIDDYKSRVGKGVGK
jgi:hypothetical protein